MRGARRASHAVSDDAASERRSRRRIVLVSGVLTAGALATLLWSSLPVPWSPPLSGVSPPPCSASTSPVTTPGAGCPTQHETTSAVGLPTTAPDGAVRPETFGARGDARSDDTQALQSALNALQPGNTLWLQGTYIHSDVLRATVAGTRIAGPGTVVARDDLRSALWLDADHVTVSGITLRVAEQGPRRFAFEQMRIRSTRHRGVRIEGVTIEGAAAAGVFLDDVDGFTVKDVVVRASRADGIHITGASRNGVVSGVRVEDSGDDGVAVVSYRTDRDVCRNIDVSDSTVADQRWGRGFSVVGGEDVRFRRITARRTSGAGLYIASEGDPFFTRSTRGVTAETVTLVEANTNPEVSHGAVLVYSAGQGHGVRDVRVSDLHVSGTSPRSGRVVGILGSDTEVQSISIDSRDLNPPPGTVGVRRLR